MDRWTHSVSKYFKYSNKSIPWLPADTKEKYEYNFKHNYDKLKKQGWIDVDIKYTFNEHGYRSDSFLKKCTILFNGCSQTVGIGLPLNMMWSKIVADHYEVLHHNIAIGGSDWSHATQRALYWIPILKPKIYIFKEPPLSRLNWWVHKEREYWEDEPFLAGNCGNGLPSDSKYKREYLDLFLHEKNQEWRRFVYTNLLKQICQEYECKMIYLPEGSPYDIKTIEPLETTYARDLQHLGVNENKVLGEYTYNKIKEYV